MKSGAAYTGHFTNGQPNGDGTMTNAEGDVYVGRYVMGQKQGQGTLTFKSGNRKFEGEWLDNMPHGHVIETI